MAYPRQLAYNSYFRWRFSSDEQIQEDVKFRKFFKKFPKLKWNDLRYLSQDTLFRFDKIYKQLNWKRRKVYKKGKWKRRIKIKKKNIFTGIGFLKSFFDFFFKNKFVSNNYDTMNYLGKFEMSIHKVESIMYNLLLNIFEKKKINLKIFFFFKKYFF